MSTSEIAKLESRWRDNPQGLTFAPLAEAYRRQKDPRRALEILQPGLERHPDYIPANIVLGRCHWDLSDLEAAEKAFAHVLTLDGENVIALKALADITERQSRPQEAERWLETLLAIDRTNDEARDQLARIRAVQSISPLVETPAGLDEPVPVDVPADSGMEPSFDDLAATPSSDPFPAIADQIRRPDPAPEPGDDALAEAVAPADTADSATAEPEAFHVEQAEEIVLNVSSGSEFQTPNAADDLMLGVGRAPLDAPRREVGPRDERPAEEPIAVPEREPDPERSSLEREPPSPAALFGSYVPDAVPPAPDVSFRYEAPEAELVPAGEPPVAPPQGEAMPAPAVGDLDAPDTTEPDLVVTETMAQVFLRQGHVVEALAVYRELAARTPDSQRLRNRVAELEARQRALTTPVPRPSFLARDTGGQSLGSFFASLLAARPESAAPASRAGFEGMELSPETAPATRPAEEPLSLGSVFGEDPPAVAPAVPPAGAAPAPEPPADAGADAVSFDDFFAGAQVPAPAPAPAPPTRPSRAKPDDDLDQFHTWLQGLKR